MNCDKIQYSGTMPYGGTSLCYLGSVVFLKSKPHILRNKYDRTNHVVCLIISKCLGEPHPSPKKARNALKRESRPVPPTALKQYARHIVRYPSPHRRSSHWKDPWMVKSRGRLRREACGTDRNDEMNKLNDYFLFP